MWLQAACTVAAAALGAATTPTCTRVAGAQGPADMVVVHPPQAGPYYSFERCKWSGVHLGNSPVHVAARGLAWRGALRQPIPPIFRSTCADAHGRPHDQSREGA